MRRRRGGRRSWIEAVLVRELVQEFARGGQGEAVNMINLWIIIVTIISLPYSLLVFSPGVSA